MVNLLREHNSSNKSSLRTDDSRSLKSQISLEEWQQVQRDLKLEIELKNRATMDLKKKEQELNEYCQQKDHELDYLRKAWKQANNELNKVLAQAQGFLQVTDNELIQKTRLLRFNIRNFADQQFGEADIDAKSLSSFWISVEKYTQIPYDLFVTCAKNPSSRHITVGAFLWAVLQQEIFGSFRWAGHHVSKMMSHLEYALSKVILVSFEKSLDL